MDETACPACKAANDEDAKYCDQCGQPLADPDKDEGDGDCPACGGTVDDQGDGRGVCRRCGLELKETAAPEAAPAALDGRLPEKLTVAILRLTAAGVAMEQAVSQGCREVLGEAPAEAAAAGDSAPCPVCGRQTEAGAERCEGCGLWFESRHRPGPCPACGAAAKADKCSCGAIQTLPALLALLEPSVRFLCGKCKQPYAVAAPSCPDCRGTMISAERLQTFAEGSAGA